MAEHALERLFVAGGGTFGRFRSAMGKGFASMEREWADNRPRVSCIPPGRYELVRWSGDRFPKHWALTGGTVRLYPGPEAKRSAIVIHAANFPRELEGCIALGTLTAGRSTFLTNSRAAIRALFAELEDTPGPHFLTIHGGA